MECTTGGAKGNMLDCYGGAGMKARAHSTSTAADHHSLIAVCERYSRCAAAESDVQRGAGAVAQKQRQSCRTSVGGKARGSELDADATIASIETRSAYAKLPVVARALVEPPNTFGGTLVDNKATAVSKGMLYHPLCTPPHNMMHWRRRRADWSLAPCRHNSSSRPTYA